MSCGSGVLLAVLYGAVVVAAAAAFSSSLQGAFVYDDGMWWLNASVFCGMCAMKACADLKVVSNSAYHFQLVVPPATFGYLANGSEMCCGESSCDWVFGEADTGGGKPVVVRRLLGSPCG